MPENGEQRIRILSKIRDPFGRIPHIIVDFYGAAMGQAGWTYTLLTRFKNSESSETYVSVKTLAITGGIDEKTVKRHAEHLEELGLIRVERDATYQQENRRARPHNYVLLLPPLPPPPDLLAKYFPANWTPPDRAMRALDNVRNLLTFGNTPQEDNQEEGVGDNLTPTPPSNFSPIAGVGDKTPPSRGQNAPQKGSPVPPNEKFLTSVTQTRTNNDMNEDVYDFLESVVIRLKPIDTTFTKEEMRGFFEDCLEATDRNQEEAKKYLLEKVEVIIGMRNPEKPKAALQTAIDRDWKPNVPKKPATHTPKKTREEREKEYEKEYEAGLEKRRKAPAEEILDHLRKTASFLPKEKAVKITRTDYSDNPNLEDAIRMFEQEGK